MSRPVSLPGGAAVSTLPPLYDEPTVAAYLGTSVRTLQRRRAAKEIPWRDLPGGPSYTLDDLNWILDNALCNKELLTIRESSTESRTSTPSSDGTAPPAFTSSGANEESRSGALRAVANLGQRKSAPAR